MYIAGNDGTVSVIDTTNNEVVDTILDVNGMPIGIAYDPDNKMVYVSNAGTTDNPALGGAVAVIDTDTNNVVDRIPIIGNNPSNPLFQASLDNSFVCLVKSRF